jgi:Tol biopolymer transport system component
VVSPDGKYVVFASAATDLIAGDTNGTTDIFVYELATGIITRIVENAVDPVISNNGVWIFYTSQADNNVYRTAR